MHLGHIFQLRLSVLGHHMYVGITEATNAVPCFHAAHPLSQCPIANTCRLSSCHTLGASIIRAPRVAQRQQQSKCLGGWLEGSHTQLPKLHPETAGRKRFPFYPFFVAALGQDHSCRPFGLTLKNVGKSRQILPTWGQS